MPDKSKNYSYLADMCYQCQCATKLIRHILFHEGGGGEAYFHELLMALYFFEDKLIWVYFF